MRKTSKKPGPKSKITKQLVRRVSRRVARGIPIRLALSGEQVTFDAYKKHLQRHPELAKIQAIGKLEFLELALDSICLQPCRSLQWLLERRHSDVFGPQQIVEDAEATEEIFGEEIQQNDQNN